MAFSPLKFARRLALPGLAGLMAVTTLGIVGSAPAEAAVAAAPTYNVVDRPTSAVTADALPTVQIDGVVWDQAIVGDTVYAGGQFANARPAGAAAGTNLTPRGNLLSFNIKTGVLNTGFAPTVNARIRAMAVSPDKSRVYIVGSFTTVNGLTRNRVAAFSTADGSLISSFAPNVNSEVFSIAVSNSAVYLGGWFTAVNGVLRTKLAAVSPTTGATLAWAPTADSTVNTMALTPDKSRVIVGGIFANLNNSPALGLGSLDATTGALYPFAANQTIQNRGNSAGIFSLKSDGTNIYGTGYWYGGTGNFEGPFVADPYTGAIKWMADCHGDTYDTAVIGSTVYSVSHHHDCSNINAFPDTNPRSRWQRANAFTMAATTTVGHNTAGGYYDFFGQPAPSVVNWFPDMPAGTYTGQSQAGWTAESTDQYLVTGGEFTLVNNTAQQGLVRFAVPSVSTNKNGPRATSADSAPTLRGISGNSVRVSWKSNYDRDDQVLTYKLYRVGKTDPLLTQTVTSQFWNRPNQSFTDTGLTPGVSYGYYVTATDPTGNTLKSNTTTITTGATTVDENNYSRAVIADGANHYWRLNEAAGTTSSVDWVNGNDLVLGTGVALGAPGAVNGSTDPAATFDGTANGTSGMSSTEPGPTTFSAEAWIKTTTTTGGKILGFGDSQLGSSGNYDRHVYMDNAGHLTFGVYPGGVRTVTTQGTYNDGAYHQVVAVLSPAGMQLYIDGLLEGTDESTTSAQAYSGYWRVGGDTYGGWPNAGSNQGFTGTIDDVSIYPTALTSTQIRSHFTASGRTVNLPPAPTDAYGAQVYADSPSFFWRLNEAAGTTAVADSSQSRTPGTAYNGVTFGSASTVAPGTSATFNGSDGTLSTNKSFTNPRNYSEEIWFNTTTTHGGKLIGFGNQQSGNSNNYDRHVYMENSGQLTYGVYTGQLNTITSPKNYNDGSWHYMVATQNTTDGMRLYVDGALVGTNGQTDAQSYAGYWRVGGDSDWGGDSAYLNGQLDEAAVYPYALTADQVGNHYFASDASVNAAPVAAFTQSCDNLACYFDGSTSVDPDGSIKSWAWDFGDGTTATGSTAPHSYTAAGTYTVTLTVKDNLNKTTTTTQSVTVTAPPVNQPPVASFTSACNELVCAFDSSTSTDDGTVSGYNWNFGDGSVSTEASPTHTYAANGTFTVTLTVTDNLGLTNTTTKSVSAKANTKPTAAFTTSCTNLACTFDASTSSDSDGTLTGYAWNFGDGSTATGATPSHTFAAGTFIVTLVVTDNSGATDTVAHTVTAQAANQAPTAAFSSLATGLSVAFDGSGSNDADGTVDSYAWTFGDTTTGTGVSPTHAYTAAGTYNVTLTVTDNRGGTNQITKSVIVSEPPNVKPSAAFSFSTTDLKVSVDGSTSTDSDGTVASYAWDYGDSATGTGKTDSHTYAAAGTYTVKLTVTDNKGATDSTIQLVTVTAAPVNVKPTAAFTSTTADLKVSVDGSNSTDSDGTLASYAWEYGDSSTGTGKTDSHTYAAAGTYTVKLTVTDNKGATDSTTKSVTVSTAPVNVKPTAAFTSTTADLKVSVDGSNSTDSDGTVASYAWEYGDSSTGTGKTDSHTYAAAGTYTVKLTVTDNKGATDSTTKSVTVTAAPVNTTVAKDNFGRTGSKWGAADTGGTWTDSGASYFATSGGQGVITIPKAGSGPTASLNSVSVQDSSTVFDVTPNKLATGGGTYVHVSSRRIGTSEYRLSVRLMPDGTVRAATTTIVGTTSTSSAEKVMTGATYAAGDTLRVRFDVKGNGTTTLSGKVWKASASEPATAQIINTSTESSLQAPGSVSLIGYLSGSSTNAPVTLAIDNYSVTRL